MGLIELKSMTQLATFFLDALWENVFLPSTAHLHSLIVEPFLCLLTINTGPSSFHVATSMILF